MDIRLSKNLAIISGDKDTLASDSDRLITHLERRWLPR